MNNLIKLVTSVMLCSIVAIVIAACSLTGGSDDSSGGGSGSSSGDETGDELVIRDVVTTAADSYRGTQLLGSTGGFTNGSSMAIDLSGDKYVIGDTGVSLDGQSLAGTQDLFVVRYNAAGGKEWTRLLGVAGQNTNSGAIALDASGDCYITGNTRGNLDGQTLTGTADLFVVKYDKSGTKQWTRLLGASGQETGGQGIAVDSAGNCYVTGITQGNLDGQTLSTSPPDGMASDAFVVKYDKDGNKLWTKLLGAAGAYTEGIEIVLDAANNFYVVGCTEGNLNSQALTGVMDVFVVKYNSSGILDWTKLIGAAGEPSYAGGACIDDWGNIYITGASGGNFDGHTLSGTVGVNENAFVVKYNSTGVKQWSKLFGAGGQDVSGFGVAVDYLGNCFITGDTFGHLDGQTLSSAPDGNFSDAFVVKYDRDGTKQWTKLMGVTGMVTSGSGIALTDAGTVYVTGNTEGNLDGQTLNGTQDCFVTSRFNQ